jgi:hypothetical protein
MYRLENNICRFNKDTRIPLEEAGNSNTWTEVVVEEEVEAPHSMQEEKLYC